MLSLKALNGLFPILSNFNKRCKTNIYWVFYFLPHNFSVWTVLRGLLREELIIFLHILNHACTWFNFRKQKTIWVDWHLLLWEYWKVLRERRLLIWFKDVVEKLPYQWTRKQVMSLWDEILGRVNFLRYIVMHSSKQQEKEEALWKPTHKLHLFP